MSVDRCVCCGEVIPDGGMVCPICKDKSRTPPVWYAIKHKKSGKYLHGTDFNYNSNRQRLSDDLCPPNLFSRISLEVEIIRRQIDLRYYEVVPVQLKEGISMSDIAIEDKA